MTGGRGGPRGALAIGVALAIGAALAACSTSPEAQDGRTASASAGALVKDGTAAPARIISIGGPVTETVFALGAGARVVAVDSSSVFPAEAGRLAQVGYQRTLAAEPILALEPDLVIAASEAGPPSTIAQLRGAGVRVEVMPEATTPTTAGDRIAAIGVALGEAERGRELAARVARDATSRARAPGPAAPRVLVVYARGAGVAMVSGRTTTAAAMVGLAGATNAIDSFDGFGPLSAELVIAAAPDVILMPSRGLTSLGGVDGVLALPGMADTPAGRARRIVALDDLLLLGFGPRLPEAIDALAAVLAAERRPTAP